MPKRIRLQALAGVASLTLALSAGLAFADSSKPDDSAPSFGNRTDKPDGSTALTIGRRLPTEWDSKVGTDVSLAAPESTVPSDSVLLGPASDRSTGAVWGNLTMPGLRPLGFDKTSLDARVDAGTDSGKLGATLSRAVPIGRDLSVTLQNEYSVTRTLASGAAPVAGIPMMANPSPAMTPVPITPPVSGPIWAAGETVRLNVNPSGTTFSAGAASSNADDLWHNKLSVEQKLLGPLTVTTSVEDAGTPGIKKSITAGFKRVW